MMLTNTVSSQGAHEHKQAKGKDREVAKRCSSCGWETVPETVGVKCVRPTPTAPARTLDAQVHHSVQVIGALSKLATLCTHRLPADLMLPGKDQTNSM